MFGATYYYSTNYGITTGQNNSPITENAVNTFTLFNDTYYFVNNVIYNNNYTELYQNKILVNSMNLFGNAYYSKNEKVYDSSYNEIIYDSSYNEINSSITLNLDKFDLHNVNYYVADSKVYDEISNFVGNASEFKLSYEIEYNVSQANKVITEDEEILVSLDMEASVSNVTINNVSSTVKFGVDSANNSW